MFEVEGDAVRKINGQKRAAPLWLDARACSLWSGREDQSGFSLGKPLLEQGLLIKTGKLHCLN